MRANSGTCRGGMGNMCLMGLFQDQVTQEPAFLMSRTGSPRLVSTPSWPYTWPPEKPQQSPPMGGLVPRVWARSWEHEGPKAGRGLPVLGNSQHVYVSQYLDREDSWVIFAILFSLEDYKSPARTHWMQCRPETCPRAWSHTCTEMQSKACLMLLREGEEVLQG